MTLQPVLPVISNIGTVYMDNERLLEKQRSIILRGLQISRETECKSRGSGLPSKSGK